MFIARPRVPLIVSLIVSVLVSVLSGCATDAGRAPAPAQGAPRGNALEIERQWLQSWFKDTPVLIVRGEDGTLAVDVPREFCFDSGRSNIKPALAAVLDKVAESLRRNAQARLQLLAAPGDGAADVALARQRAAQVRAHLRSRGVAETRLGQPSVTSIAAVQLRLQWPAP